MPTDQNTVRKWLMALGALSAGSLTPMEVEAKLGTMAPLLAEEFDPEAFTKASLVRAARASKFFPVFAEVCDALRATVRDARPLMPRLASPGPAPREAPTAEQIAANRAKVAELKATEAPRGSSVGTPRTLSPAQLLTIYEAQAADGHGPSATRAAHLRAQLEVQA